MHNFLILCRICWPSALFCLQLQCKQQRRLHNHESIFCDPTRQISDPIRPADHNQYIDPTRPH